MSTNYRMMLNYDNDKKQFYVPVLPEKLKITVKGQTTSINIDRLGELLHKGRRDAITVSFSSYFPSEYGSFCHCPSSGFKNPKSCHNWIIALIQAHKPLHLVLTGSPIGLNMYALITSYIPEERGGDVGTIYYNIEMKEYRTASVKKVTIKQTNKKPTKQSTGGKQRVNNSAKSKKYTIKKGDCLWNIAKKYYGSGSKHTKIYNANKSVLDNAAKKHGHRSSNNGKLIFPGTKITIP